MKVTSSFGKRPIKVVEQVVCSTDDIAIWRLEAQIEELYSVQLEHGNYVTQTFAGDKGMSIMERIADLKTQLAALRGETV